MRSTPPPPCIGPSGTDAVGAQQDQQIIDVDHPVTIEITEAWLWAISAIAMCSKPLSEVVDTFLFRGIHDAATGHAARTQFRGRGTIHTLEVGQPIPACIKAVLLPGLQAPFAQAAGPHVRAVITTAIVAQPDASDGEALVLPHQRTSRGQAAGAWLWRWNACGAIRSTALPIATEILAVHRIGNHAVGGPAKLLIETAGACVR